MLKKTIILISPVWILILFMISCSKKESAEYTSPQGWIINDSPTSGAIRGLSALTEEIAWAAGQNGTWMKTIDGGLTWTSGVIDGLDTVDFRDIEGINASTALAISAGQPAVIYKTTDAGASWEKKYEGSDRDFFNGMVFIDDNSGFAYGDPVDGAWMILRTIDGGDTWVLLPQTPEAAEGEAGFAASGSSMAMDEDEIWLASGGSKSNIYYSKNRGGRWEIINTPIRQGLPSQGIFSITIIDNRSLIAVGGDYERPNETDQNVIISHTDGMSWEKNSGNDPSGYLSAVAYFPRFHWVIAVGPNGSDYSIDGGENWEKFSDEGFHTVKKSKSGGSVWAAGQNGKIGKLDFLKK